jgi:hypothetical protein
VRIDAGSHGVIESLPRLVDAASGSVYLRLVPHHLSRLHPPDLRGDFVPCNRDASSSYEFPSPERHRSRRRHPAGRHETFRGLSGGDLRVSRKSVVPLLVAVDRLRPDPFRVGHASHT